MQKQFQQIERLIELRQIKKAEVQIARALRSTRAPRSQAKLLLYRARVRLLTARPDEALDDIETAIQNLDHETPPADILELKADCFLARFELSPPGFAERASVRKAQDLYQQIIEQHQQYTNLGWVYYQLGRISLIIDRVAAAEKFFHRALLSPSHVRALTAYCYERLGFIAFYESRQNHQSLTFLNKAIDTYPDSEPPLWKVQVYILCSRVLREIQPDDALRAAEQALQIASTDNSGNRAVLSEALFTIAELLYHRKQYHETLIDYLQQFIQVTRTPPGVDVTWSRVYEMLADSYFDLKQFDHAISAYEKALQFNPDHPWEENLRYRIAYSYYQIRAYQKTIEIIQGIVPSNIQNNDELSGSDYRLYSVLGNAYFALEQYREAERAYEKALHIAPRTADVRQIRTSYQASRRMNHPL